MTRIWTLLVWLIAAPVWAQTSYQYTFTHDRLNTTYYATCVDAQACISIGMPATNVATFILADGTHTIKLQACNAYGCTPLGSATGNPITVTVSTPPPPPPPVCPTITISPTSLTSGQVGTAYSQTLLGVGGGSPYSFAVSAGTLPPGLALTAAGMLSGTPTLSINANFTVRATDANSCTGTQPYLLTINAAPPPPPAGTLLDWEFPTSASPRFANTLWSPLVGRDGAVGFMRLVGTTLTQSQAFPVTTTGTVRFDFYVRVADGYTGNGSAYDFTLLLLPDTGAISVANSAGNITIQRSIGSGATSAVVRLQVQNGATTVPLSLMTRGVWHKLSIVATIATKKSGIYLDNTLLATIAWPNQAIVSVGQVGVIAGSLISVQHIDSLMVVSQ